MHADRRAKWKWRPWLTIFFLMGTPTTGHSDELSEPSDGLYGGKLGIVFRDIPEQPAILKGLIARTMPNGIWGGIDGVQGIFETPSGTWVGPARGEAVGSGSDVRVEAKPGYAVGVIELKYDERLHGMRLIFMRIKDGHLDPNDKYRSRWVGARSGGKEASLGGNGKPITGITGRTANDLHAFGILQVDGASAE
jgi:hypothetical protein